jgi:hypothetical protein
MEGPEGVAVAVAVGVSVGGSGVGVIVGVLVGVKVGVAVDVAVGVDVSVARNPNIETPLSRFTAQKMMAAAPRMSRTAAVVSSMVGMR